MIKKLTALILSISLCISGGSIVNRVQAKNKIALNVKKVTLYVGKYRQLNLKGISKKNRKKVVWKTSNKKIVRVGKYGKIKAVRKGSAKVTARFKKKNYICRVTVKKKSAVTVTVSPAIEETVVPSVNPKATDIPSANPQETAEASISPIITPSESPVESESANESTSPSIDVTNIPAVSPNESVTPSESAEASISPVITPSESPVESESAKESISPAIDVTNTPAVSPGESVTPSESAEASKNPVITPSESPEESETPEESASPTATPSQTDKPGESDTSSATIITASANALTVGQMEVIFGESFTKTKERIGAAKRSNIPSAFGYKIYAYNPGDDCNNLLYIFTQNDVVKGMYTISPYANFGNLVKSGMSVSELDNDKFSQNTNAGNDGLYTYEANGYTVEAYVDIKGTNKVYGIRVYSDENSFDDMMLADNNSDNYKAFESTVYNGTSLYVSDEYDYEFAELVSAYRLSTGINGLKIYNGCGREMAEIGASNGYSSATDYSSTDRTLMKNSVTSQGSGRITAGLKSMYAYDTYADPFTVVTNFAELDETYPAMSDTTRNCIMAGYAYSPGTEQSCVYAVLWGTTTGGL